MQNNKIRIIGSYLSPYVRKVLVCLGLKGLRYEIDPIVPFFGSDEFGRLSPLRCIPVLIDGELSIADIANANFFRNAAFARYSVDGTRWPKVKRFLDATLNLDAFLQLRKFEDVCLTTPIAEQRNALRAAGAPITDVTVGTPTPRQGFFAI